MDVVLHQLNILNKTDESSFEAALHYCKIDVNTSFTMGKASIELFPVLIATIILTIFHWQTRTNRIQFLDQDSAKEAMNSLFSFIRGFLRRDIRKATMDSVLFVLSVCFSNLISNKQGHWQPRSLVLSRQGRQSRENLGSRVGEIVSKWILITSSRFRDGDFLKRPFVHIVKAFFLNFVNNLVIV